MNKTPTLLFLLCFLWVLIACEKKDLGITPSPYLGYYKVTYFTSNVAIDINQDGVAENIFLKELNKAWFENGMNLMGKHHISIRPSQAGTNSIYALSNGMP